MGQLIESMAREMQFEIVAILDKAKDWDQLSIVGEKPVVIDFSEPQAVVGNIKRCFELQLPVVVGTTGWDEYFDEIKQLCNEGNHAIIKGSNFSIGMNLFFAVNQYLAKAMNGFSQYKASLKEIHHTRKLDKPSGTAITLSNQIIDKIDNLKSWSLQDNDESTLPVSAIREGDVPGTHLVKYESGADSITLKHEAKNRKGFAVGALKAAEWIQDKKGFFDVSNMYKV